jgi:hypothetical protein
MNLAFSCVQAVANGESDIGPGIAHRSVLAPARELKSP